MAFKTCFRLPDTLLSIVDKSFGSVDKFSLVARWLVESIQALCHAFLTF